MLTRDTLRNWQQRLMRAAYDKYADPRDVAHDVLREIERAIEEMDREEARRV